MHHALNWAINNPDRYVLLGIGIAFVLCLCLLMVGGNPGALFDGNWKVIAAGWVIYILLWPVVIPLFLIIGIAMAGE